MRHGCSRYPRRGSWPAPSVPGIFDGLMLALEKYGTMSFAEVAAPAIELAEGFPLPEIYARYIRINQRVLALLAVFDEVLPAHRGRCRNGAKSSALPLSLGPCEIALAAAEKQTRGKRAPRIAGGPRLLLPRSASAGHRGTSAQRNGGLITIEDWQSFTLKLITPRPPRTEVTSLNKPGFLDPGSGDAGSAQHAGRL